MKRTNTPTAIGDCTVWCSTCRARAATGHTGPFTASELQQFAVEQVHIKRDPDIIAAETERDTARAVFDSLDITWQAALAARTRADIRGETTTAERRCLNEAEAAAREIRDRSWAAVVKANEKLRGATLAAQEKQRANAAS